MDPTTAQFLPSIANLGVAGFAIFVMWKMYETSGKQLQKGQEELRDLEKEVRTSITGQLMENTKVMERTTTVMERVVDMLNRK